MIHALFLPCAILQNFEELVVAPCARLQNFEDTVVGGYTFHKITFVQKTYTS
jgi:hypothetical protein